MPRVQVLLPLPSSREPVNAYITAFAGFFHAQIARMDTLYRYWITVAKFSKCPNIREYSNGYRPVHHQKSISQFPEKDGLAPCAEDGDWRRKEMHLFCSTLLCVKQKICLTVVVGRDRMGLTLVGKIIKNQEDDEDE